MAELPVAVRWQLWIIALPAIIFARVPNDTTKNVVIARRNRRST